MSFRVTPGRSIVTKIVSIPSITSVAGSIWRPWRSRLTVPGPRRGTRPVPGGRGAKRSSRSRSRRITSGTEGLRTAPSSPSMGIPGPFRTLKLLPVSAAVLAAALRATGASPASARLRGDHVVDPDDHHGRLCCGSNRLRAYADRLHDVLLPHVGDLAGEDVHAGVLAPPLVLLAELDEGVNRVEPCVLREGAGDDLHRIRERLDRDLLAAADRGRVVPQALGDLRGGRTASRDHLAVLDRARDDAERVLEGSLDLVHDVLRPAANQDRDRKRVLGARHERHLVVADLLLVHELRVPQVHLRDLIELRDDLPARRLRELLHVGLLHPADRIDPRLREEVLRQVVNPLLAEH